MSIEYFDRTHSKPSSASIKVKDDGYYLSINDELSKIHHIKVLDKSDSYWRIEIETDSKGVLVVSDSASIQHLCQIRFI